MINPNKSINFSPSAPDAKKARAGYCGVNITEAKTMSSEASYRYHLPHRVSLSGIFAGMWFSLLWYWGSPSLDALILVTLNVVVVLVGIWSISIVEINHNGVVLYRVNKLVWSDVHSAKRVKFFGLNHIRVKRKKGFPLWIPMYFKGHRPIEKALVACAPTASALSQVQLDIKIS